MHLCHQLLYINGVSLQSTPPATAPKEPGYSSKILRKKQHFLVYLFVLGKWWLQTKVSSNLFKSFREPSTTHCTSWHSVAVVETNSSKIFSAPRSASSQSPLRRESLTLGGLAALAALLKSHFLSITLLLMYTLVTTMYGELTPCRKSITSVTTMHNC